jgi:hypothetical protein
MLAISQRVSIITVTSRSTLITLYRPFVLQSLGNQRGVAQDKESQDWLLSIERKATAAAMNTNNALGDMIMADMICLSQSLM